MPRSLTVHQLFTHLQSERHAGAKQAWFTAIRVDTLGVRGDLCGDGPTRHLEPYSFATRCPRAPYIDVSRGDCPPSLEFPRSTTVCTRCRRCPSDEPAGSEPMKLPALPSLPSPAGLPSWFSLPTSAGRRHRRLWVGAGRAHIELKTATRRRGWGGC